MKYNEDEIVKRYQSGENTKSIAMDLGTYNTTIRRILIRNGIAPRSNSEAQRIVKENPFLNIERDYWLGLLASDGCLTNNAIVLELQEQDEYILREYIKFIGYNLSLLTTKSKRFNTFQRRVSFKNPEAYRYLIELGITPKKSSTLKVNFKINYDFLRGVIDGDGSISKTNKGNSIRVDIVSASVHFIEQIANFYKEEGIDYRIYKRNNTNLICVNRKDSTKKLYDNLYREGCIYLTRKYNKFGYFIQKWNEKNLAKTGKEPSSNPVLASNIEL